MATIRSAIIGVVKGLITTSHRITHQVAKEVVTIIMILTTQLGISVKLLLRLREEQTKRMILGRLS